MNAMGFQAMKCSIWTFNCFNGQILYRMPLTCYVRDRFIHSYQHKTCSTQSSIPRFHSTQMNLDVSHCSKWYFSDLTSVFKIIISHALKNKLLKERHKLVYPKCQFSEKQDSTFLQALLHKLHLSHYICVSHG